MKSDRKRVMEVGYGLMENETVRLPCWFCGAEHERTLAITRQRDRIVFICPRAKCGAKGHLMLNGVEQKASKAPEKPATARLRGYQGETTAIPERLKTSLLRRYGVCHESWRWEPAYDRLVMPVVNHYGSRYGTAVKALDWNAWNGPKVVNYFDDDSNIGHWVAKQGQYVVICEDIISAHAIPNEKGHALLGTHMNNLHAMLLAQSFDNWVLMLDPDASYKARKIKQWYGALLRGKILVIVPPRDPKDCSAAWLRSTLEEVEEILDERREDHSVCAGESPSVRVDQQAD